MYAWRQIVSFFITIVCAYFRIPFHKPTTQPAPESATPYAPEPIPQYAAEPVVHAPLVATEPVGGKDATPLQEERRVPSFASTAG